MSPKLREEIMQSSPFGSLEQEVFLNVVRTASDLEHSMAEGLKPYGLSLTQYNVLRILRGAGEDGLCRGDIVARMLTPVPDATRLLERLVKAGWVSRERGGDDRRFVTTRITDSGRALLADLDGPMQEMHRRQLGHMGQDELTRLSDLLETARARV